MPLPLVRVLEQQYSSQNIKEYVVFDKIEDMLFSLHSKWTDFADIYLLSELQDIHL